MTSRVSWEREPGDRERCRRVPVGEEHPGRDRWRKVPDGRVVGVVAAQYLHVRAVDVPGEDQDDLFVLVRVREQGEGELAACGVIPRFLGLEQIAAAGRTGPGGPPLLLLSRESRPGARGMGRLEGQVPQEYVVLAPGPQVGPQPCVAGCGVVARGVVFQDAYGYVRGVGEVGDQKMPAGVVASGRHGLDAGTRVGEQGGHVGQEVAKEFGKFPVAVRLDGLGSLLVEHVAVAVVEALQGKLAAERGD